MLRNMGSCVCEAWGAGGWDGASPATYFFPDDGREWPDFIKKCGFDAQLPLLLYLYLKRYQVSASSCAAVP